MIWRRLKKNTPKDDEALARQMEEIKSSPRDIIAMLLSAFLVIVLPCLLILLAFGFLAMLFFGIL